jgi:ankyrin repeat protein
VKKWLDLCEHLEGTSQSPWYAASIRAQVANIRSTLDALEKITQTLRGSSQKIRRGVWLVRADRVMMLRKQLLQSRTNIQEILSIHTVSVVRRPVAPCESDPSSHQTMHIASLLTTFNENTVASHKSSTASLDVVSSHLTNVPVSDVSNFNGQVTTQQTQSCRTRCWCRCHNGKARERRVKLLTTVLGSLSLLYAGMKVAGQHCDDDRCRNAGTFSVEIRYSAPTWTFSARLEGGVRPLYGNMSATLKAKNRTGPVTHRNPTILDAVRFGTPAALQVFLGNKRGSIHDVRAEHGASALDYALGSNWRLGRPQFENVNILLALGADPFAEDDLGRMSALVEIIASYGRPSAAALKPHLLPSMTSFEDYELSHVTKVVLGFRPLDIGAELEKPENRALVNWTDKMGLTPLHWAATIGNSEAVLKLIEAGADLDAKDPWENTSLVRACQRSSSALCTKALLLAGASIDSANSTTHHALHEAAAAGQSEDVLSLLLARGTDVRAPSTSWRDSPLSLAALANRPETCKFLLSRGACIDARDWEGDTALNETIRANAHEAMTVLLAAGADYCTVNDNGRTALHHIAERGDVTTVAIYSEVDLTKLDSEATDKEGRTAHDSLLLRHDVCEDFKTAFLQLLERIKAANSPSHPEIGSDAAEVFLDAFELLSADAH